MTKVYFVRHCQSQKGWKESDSIRPLTAQGIADSALVTQALHDTPLDYCICSPYLRSMNTIGGCAADHGLEIHTDTRFGERISGPNNTDETLRMRWADRDYHEDGGESINMVKARNLEGLRELLDAHAGERILLGTHGTALSSILDYYDSGFGGLDGFTRLYEWMPYIILLTFDGQKLVSQDDMLIVDRGY